MERRVLVAVLLIQSLPAQMTNLLFEVTANLAKNFLRKQMFKLIKQPVSLPRIKRRVQVRFI
jgi:hypothetical protein